MREDTRSKRRAEIELVAYALLETHGYGGTSMLAVAKEAKASNETMYRWYGNKQGLFRAMVQSNAAQIEASLTQALADQSDPLTVLRRIAPVLLSMLLGDRAILLNRAAAADPSGELGEAIAQGGRETIVPLIHQMMERICAQDPTIRHRPKVLSQWYIRLLLGDQQIRRVIGTMPTPSAVQTKRSAAAAFEAFQTLMRS